jgi:predicted phage terminase large subunit-like protein
MNPSFGLQDMFEYVVQPLRPDHRDIMPDVFTEEKIREIVISEGWHNYTSQYLLWPMGDKGVGFADSHVKNNVKTQMPPVMNKYLLLDPAMGLGDEHDFTALVIVGLPPAPSKDVWVLHAEQRKKSSYNNCRRAIELARKWHCKAIAPEGVRGVIAYEPTLKDLMAEDGGDTIPVRGVKPGHRSKDSRIAHVISLWERENLKVWAGCVDLMKQMESYGAGHDDLIDAVAYYKDVPGVCRPFVEHEPTPEEKANQKISDAEMQLMEELAGGKFGRTSVLVDGQWN